MDSGADPNQLLNMNLEALSQEQQGGLLENPGLRSIWSSTPAAPTVTATTSTPQATGTAGLMAQGQTATHKASMTESERNIPHGFGNLDYEILGIAGETDDPNDPLVTVLMAIPMLGTGVEHIYAKKSKIKDLVALLNSDGFYRAIPTRLEKFFHPAQSTSTLASASSQQSTSTLQSSMSSFGGQGSQTSLTESQREIFGLQQNLKWPLDSTTNLLFGSEPKSSRLDITGEKQMLLRRLQKLNKYEQDLMSLQRRQMTLLREQLQGQHSQSFPPTGIHSSQLLGHSFAQEQQDLIEQSNKGLGLTTDTPQGQLGQQQHMMPTSTQSLGQQQTNVPSIGIQGAPVPLMQPPQQMAQPASGQQPLMTGPSNPYGVIGSQLGGSGNVTTGSDAPPPGSLDTPMNISSANVWSYGSADQQDGRRGNL